MSDRDTNFAKELAVSGYKFDKEIQQNTKRVIKNFPHVNLFLVAISQSLTWTGHAIDKNKYFENCFDFLVSDSQKALSALSGCAGRYGDESLKSLLFNWRKLYNKLHPPQDWFKVSLEQIVFFQSASLKIACNLRMKNEVAYIGAWLFCAPFKILLCLRDDLWKSDRLNEVLMPLGLEVVRGVKKTICKKYSYASFVNEGDLVEEEGDIVEGLGTIHIVQAMCKNISKDAGSNVLHVNSGLWKLGSGDLILGDAKK